MIIKFNQDLEFIIGVPNVRAMKIFYDFNTAISNIGRATDNNLGAYIPDGRSHMLYGRIFNIFNLVRAKGMSDSHTKSIKWHLSGNKSLNKITNCRV